MKKKYSLLESALEDQEEESLLSSALKQQEEEEEYKRWKEAQNKALNGLDIINQRRGSSVAFDGQQLTQAQQARVAQLENARTRSGRQALWQAAEDRAMRNRNNIGLVDPEIANVYGRMAEDAARIGDEELLEYAKAGYQNITNASRRQWDEETRRRQGTAYQPGQVAPTATGSPYDAYSQITKASNDINYYYRMADYAAQMGMEPLYNEAIRKIEELAGSASQDAAIALDQGKSVDYKQQYDKNASGWYNSAAALEEMASIYGTPEQQEQYAEEKRKAGLKYEKDQPSLYYAQTMSREDIQKQIDYWQDQVDRLDAENERMSSRQNEITAMNPEYYEDGRQVTSEEELRKLQAMRDEEIQSLGSNIEDNRATYKNAYAMLQRYKQAMTVNNVQIAKQAQWDVLNDPRYSELVKEGKAKYEQDKDGDWTRVFFSAGEANQAYKDLERNQMEFGLSEQETQIYYAIYAKDPDKAHAYADARYQVHVSRFADKLRGVTDDSPWARASFTANAAVLKLIAGLTPFTRLGRNISEVSNMLLDASGESLKEKGILNTGLLSGTIHTETFGDLSLKDATNLASSIIQSWLIAQTAGVAGVAMAGAGASAAAVESATEVAALFGTALMGSSAANDTFYQRLDQGWDTGSALTEAITAGINEALFEYFSVDKLINQDITRGFLRNVVTQGLTEASEELCTTIANTIDESVIAGITGNKTEVENRADELMGQGLDYDEAISQARHEWMVGLIQDAVGGFLSGGAMTMGNYASGGINNVGAKINELQYNRQSSERAGRSVQNAGETQALQDFAKANGIKYDEKSVTATQERIASQTEAAEAAQEMTVREMQDSETAQESGKEGKQSKKETRTLGELKNQVTDKISQTIRKEGIESAERIRDQLVEKYGEGILPSVYQAISTVAAQKASTLSSTDAIRTARNKAVQSIQDADVRQAVVDGYDQAAVYRAAQTNDADEFGRYIQQTRNTGEGTMTMEATVKAEDGSERQVAITGVSEDGKSVVLSDGVKIAVKDLQADADTMDVVQQLSRLELGQNTDKVFQAFRQSGLTGSEGYRFIMDYATAYNQGRTGSLTLEEATKRSSLDARTVMDAYELGQKETYADTQKAVDKVKAMPVKEGATGHKANIDVSRIEGKTMNQSEQEQFDFANKVFAAAGVDVVWFASDEKGGRFVGKNGAYENGKIWMDIHAGRNFLSDLSSGIMATTGHELTHFLQQYAPEHYQALKQFLFRQIVKNSKNGEMTLERLIWEKQKRSGTKLSRKAAEDEVVADACQKMLRDSKAIHEFASQNEEAAKGMARWLDKWFAKIRDIFGRSAQFSEEAEFMDRLGADVKKAFGELWDAAMREAVRTHDEVGDMKNPATEGGEQFSIRQTNNGQLYVQADRQVLTGDDPTQWGHQIENYINQTIRNGQDFVVPTRDGSHFLALTSRSAYKLKDRNKQSIRHNVEGLLAEDQYHLKGVAATHIDELIQVALFSGYEPDINGWHENDIGEDGFNYFTAFFRDFDGKYYRVQFSAGINGAEETVYSIGDIRERRFPTDTGSSSQGEALKNGGKPSGTNGNTDTTKSQAPKTALAAALEKAQQEKARRGQNSDRDSHGNELSAEQREYFKGSKAVDKDGNLLVLYRGKRGGETVIHGDYRGAIWTTTDPEFADRYGVKDELYANITNPYYKTVYNTDAKGNTSGYDIDAVIRDAKNGEHDGAIISFVLNTGEGAKTSYIDFMVQNHPDMPAADVLQNWAQHSYMDARKGETIGEFWKRANEGPVSQHVVAFSSEQLKRTDNKTPTADRDIRYSERDSFAGKTPVEAVRDLIAVHNMTEQNLRDVLDLGGFPSPSIAIVKAANGHTNYGPISVVFGRDSIDPAIDPRNHIYGADAWTPTARNSKTETEVDNNKRNALDDKLWELSKKVANGTFAESSVLTGRMGYNGSTEYSLEEILDRVATEPTVLAAYLADNGIEIQPVMKSKQFDSRGNDFLRKIIDSFGAQQLADIMSRAAQGESMTEEELAKVREIYAEDVANSYSPALKERRGMDFLRQHAAQQAEKLGPWKLQEMVDHAWQLYESNGNDRSEIDYHPTLEAMKQAIDPEHRIDGLMEDKIKKTVGDWLRPKVKEIMGRKGIYNGKDIFTPSGNRRSFWQLHDAYTLENIVRNMNKASARGEHTYGMSAGTLQAVSAPEYKSIYQVRADKGRLARVSDEVYKAQRKKIEDRIPEITEKILNENEGTSVGNAFEDASIVGEVIIMAANGPRTTASIQRTFQRESDFKVSKESAKEILQLYKDAANLPTEYFEAKPQRAMYFDEIKAVILPSNTDKELVQGLRGRGVDVRIFEPGNDAQRTKILNSMDDAKFQDRSYDMPSDAELLMQAKADDAASLEQKKLLKEYQERGRRLAELEKQLAEAKRQTKLTNKALNARGIGNVTKTIMQNYGITDARHRDTAKRATQVLTDGYQKALDLIDKGADAAAVMDAVYAGAVEAAEIVLENGTFTQKIGSKWQVASASRYLGESRQQLVDEMVSEAYADFATNRYREAVEETAADRLVARTKSEMQERVDKYKGRSEALEEANRRLEEMNERAKNEAELARKTVGGLYQDVLDLREELKTNKSMTAQERKAAQKKLDSLTKRLDEKRQEAQDWKKRAQRNASLMKSALESKNRDIRNLESRMSAERQEALRKSKALEIKLEKQIQRENDIMAGKLRSPELTKLLKKEREAAAKKMAEHKEEVFRNYKELKSATAIRNRIKNLHAEMTRDLLRPREGHFIPQNFVRSATELLEMINTQTNRAKSEDAQAKIDALNAAYDRLKNDERYSQFYDETVKQMLVELSTTVAGRSIYDLSAPELEDVYTAMKAMRTTIRNAIKADLIEKGRTAWEIGDQLRQELRRGKGISWQFAEKYLMTMLSAKRAFNRFGGYRQDSTWNKVYQMLDDAQLKQLTMEMQATRLFDPVLKAKADLKQAEALTSYSKKDLVDVGLKDEHGDAVPITRGMMLSLYMHMQNEENMRHLMYGGLTLPDFQRYYKSQGEAWGRGSVEIPALGAKVANLDQLFDELGEEGVDQKYKEYEQEIREMFESVRSAIEEELTDYDRKWIDASRQFFDGFSRQELNKVTNELYGFSKAKVDNYFPIVTDPAFLKSEFESISRNISLENAGFMKERVKASNPILLEDITRAVNRQINNVSRYAGLTQALKQFGMIYNTQTKGFTDSIKKAMQKTYGQNGLKYIENLITDMIGGRSQDGSIFDKIKGNYAQAVLSANLSVTIKQAASFPTAAATVGWGPILKALAKGGKSGLPISRADRTLIDTYSPLLWKRAQGAIDTEIGDMAHAKDWTKKAQWLMGWIQKTDLATVGRLWSAAEYYVKDNFKTLEKGTEEQIKNGESPFYRKVAEVFNQIVEDTQPNYTVLQRPDILRNPNKLVRAMTMFSTQRFQNANILMDAVNEYAAMVRYDKQGRTAETKAARKEAKAKLTRAISSQVVSAVVLNAMTLLAGAVLHRMNPWRDDDDELTAASIAEEYLNGFISSLAGSFLGGSELYEAIHSLLTGSKYYGNDVGGISTINEFAKAVVQFGQSAVKIIGDEDSTPDDWKKLAESQLTKVGEYLAQMTGIPVANINKIISGGKNHVIDIVNGEFGSFEAGLTRANATNARRFYKAWQAGDSAKMDKVYQELLNNANGDADKAREAISKAFKTAYDADDMSLEDYTRFITDSGLFDEKQQKNRIQTVAKNAVTDGSMSENEAERYLVESGFYDADNAWETVQRWVARAEYDEENEGGEDADDFTWSKYDAIDAAVDAGQNIDNLVSELTEHGAKADSVKDHIRDHLAERFISGEINEKAYKNMLSRYCGIVGEAADKLVRNASVKKQTGYTWNDLSDAYLDGNISAAAAKQALTQYGGMTAAEASARVRYWDFRKQYPDAEMKQETVDKYDDNVINGYGKTLQGSGISLSNFVDYYTKASKATGTDKNGDGKADSGTKKAEIMQIIDALNLTDSQKDALYYYNGWSAKTINEAPWH